MKSRRRVLGALEHREPDRVPVFGPNIMDTREPYDPGLRAFLDEFDFDELAGPDVMVDAPSAQRELGEGISVDGYGCQYRYMGVGLPYCTFSPLAQAETIADVEAFDWPDPEAPGLITEGARDRARKARKKTDRAIAVGLCPLFHQYHYLRGFEQWMVDMKLNRGLHEAISAHLHRINSTLALRVLEEVGEYVDIVTMGDDLGTSTMSYMSPEDFRALIKPYYHDLITGIKTRFPHLKVYLHSHGQIMGLVGDLIECGVDVLNPVLPLDNMDPVRLKREFGNDLCFHGGIDVERILPFGTADEVREHVKEVMDILAPGGGYWFKAQVISPIIPPENVIAAYECAREHGGYR